MRWYTGNYHIAVLRRGHIFRVAEGKDGRAAAYEELKSAFKSILDASETLVPSIASLTAKERDFWARVSLLRAQSGTGGATNGF